MNRTKRQVEGLPEPMALTPEQMLEMATATAGGLSLISSLIIRAGGYPPFPTTMAAAAGAATLAA